MTAVLVAYRKTARRRPKVFESVRAELASRHSGLAVLIAESPEALGRWSADLVAARVIYLAGGDGLLRDLVNLIASEEGSGGAGSKRVEFTGVPGRGARSKGMPAPVALGVIPMGTGNEIARALRIPLDPLRAARTIGDTSATVSGFAGRVAMLDGVLAPAAVGGIYTERAPILFVNSVGTGIDNATVEARETLARIGLNHYFFIFLFGVLPRLKPFPVRVFRNDELIYEGESVWTIAFRGPCIGGGLVLNPEADIRDQEMHLMIVKGAPRLLILREVRRVFSGRASESPLVVRFRGCCFRLEFDAPRAVSIDGDILVTARRLLLEGGPALHFLAPASSPRGERETASEEGERRPVSRSAE